MVGASQKDRRKIAEKSERERGTTSNSIICRLHPDACPLTLVDQAGRLPSLRARLSSIPDVPGAAIEGAAGGAAANATALSAVCHAAYGSAGGLDAGDVASALAHGAWSSRPVLLGRKTPAV